MGVRVHTCASESGRLRHPQALISVNAPHSKALHDTHEGPYVPIQQGFQMPSSIAQSAVAEVSRKQEHGLH